MLHKTFPQVDSNFGASRSVYRDGPECGGPTGQDVLDAMQAAAAKKEYDLTRVNEDLTKTYEGRYQLPDNIFHENVTGEPMGWRAEQLTDAEVARLPEAIQKYLAEKKDCNRIAADDISALMQDATGDNKEAAKVAASADHILTAKEAQDYRQEQSEALKGALQVYLKLGESEYLLVRQSDIEELKGGKVTVENLRGKYKTQEQPTPLPVSLDDPEDKNRKLIIGENMSPEFRARLDAWLRHDGQVATADEHEINSLYDPEIIEYSPDKGLVIQRESEQLDAEEFLDVNRKHEGQRIDDFLGYDKNRIGSVELYLNKFRGENMAQLEQSVSAYRAQLRHEFAQVGAVAKLQKDAVGMEFAENESGIDDRVQAKLALYMEIHGMESITDLRDQIYREKIGVKVLAANEQVKKLDKIGNYDLNSADGRNFIAGQRELRPLLISLGIIEQTGDRANEWQVAEGWQGANVLDAMEAARKSLRINATPRYINGAVVFPTEEGFTDAVKIIPSKLDLRRNAPNAFRLFAAISLALGAPAGVLDWNSMEHTPIDEIRESYKKIAGQDLSVDDLNMLYDFQTSGTIDEKYIGKQLNTTLNKEGHTIPYVDLSGTNSADSPGHTGTVESHDGIAPVTEGGAQAGH